MSFPLTWAVSHRACASPSSPEQIRKEDRRVLDPDTFQISNLPLSLLILQTYKLSRWDIASLTVFYHTMPWMIESLDTDILYHGLCIQTQCCLVFMVVCLCRFTMDGHLYHLHIHMHRGHYSSLFTFPLRTCFVGVWKTAPRKCAGNVHYHFNGWMYSLKLFIVPNWVDWVDKRDSKTRKL